MVKKLIVILVMLTSLLGGLIVVSQPVLAAAGSCDNSASFLGLPTWYHYLETGPDSTGKCGITGPQNSQGQFDWRAGISRIALAVVDILLRLAAIISVGFVIYGGFRYILSQGDPENTKKARNTILNAIIGLVVTAFSTAIVNLVGNTLWK